MHKMVKNSLCLALLISCSTGFTVAPYYSIRSQSENAALELVGAGCNTQINLCDIDTWYGNFSITPEYTRSFRPCHIAQCLFGCSSSCCGPCETSIESKLVVVWFQIVALVIGWQTTLACQRITKAA